jgi:hypothetical protein
MDGHGHSESDSDSDSDNDSDSLCEASILSVLAAVQETSINNKKTPLYLNGFSSKSYVNELLNCGHEGRGPLYERPNI